MNPYAGQIYIDGSCLKNPGRGGVAGVLELPTGDSKIIFQQGYKSTTNNRMEIRALIKALEYTRSNVSSLKNYSISNVEICSDSEYAVRCYRNVERWRTNKWVGKEGNPIMNLDLLKKILTLKNATQFSYRVDKVLGKSTEATKMVDKLAKQAAKGSRLIIDDGYIGGKISRTSIKGATLPFNAEGQQIIVRIFEHKRVSRRQDAMYKVKFEIATSNGAEKYYAYTSHEIDMILDRSHYYRTQFNSNSKNPCIEAVEEVDKSEFSL